VCASGIIAFAFGDTILPEVQATVGGNAKVNMYKGVSFGYSILLSSYMIVAIAGEPAKVHAALDFPFSTAALTCLNNHMADDHGRDVTVVLGACHSCIYPVSVL
jgi:hypothetical protein